MQLNAGWLAGSVQNCDLINRSKFLPQRWS